jgi:hypothetical protein
MHLKNLNEEKIYELIWDAIDWWKHKNLYKRPIDKDDAKALRMIVKKLKGMQN